MYSDLNGKVAIVTGASSLAGIGRTIAQTLAESGAKVVCADIAETHLQEAADAIGGSALRTDITDPGAVDLLVQHALEKFGRLDILVNNAAAFCSGNALDISISDFDRVFAVNVRGTFLCSQAAARVMIESEGGSIVNISSLGGKLAFCDMAVYCASKGGVDALTRGLAADWAPKIRVNAVAPGHMATPPNLEFLHRSREHERHFERRVLLGGLGEPAQIAHAVAFLASDQSRYMTGQIITVDGGLSAWQGPVWP